MQKNTGFYIPYGVTAKKRARKIEKGCLQDEMRPKWSVRLQIGAKHCSQNEKMRFLSSYYTFRSETVERK